MLVPLQLSFPVMNRALPAVTACNIVTDLLLAADIYLSFSLSFTIDAEKITDPVRSAGRYIRTGFLFDLLCALPYSMVVQSRGFARAPRLLRCRSLLTGTGSALSSPH